jgi:hypothetical protein
MRSLQFNPTDGIADQFKNCYYYNDIYDAFLLVFFKFHLGVEPVSEIFGKIFICCTISFLAKLAVSKNFTVY